MKSPQLRQGLRLHGRDLRPATNHQALDRDRGLRICRSAGRGNHGADVLSVHIGLDAWIGDRFLFQRRNRRSEGALRDEGWRRAVNYDRGEVVDTAALAEALSTGKNRASAIDADLFKDVRDRQAQRAMLPYLPTRGTHKAGWNSCLTRQPTRIIPRAVHRRETA